MEIQRTFILIKPDAVQRGIVHGVIKRFERRGYTMIGMKAIRATEMQLRSHYREFENEPFFPDLLTYMMSGPCIACVWEGVNVVADARRMLVGDNTCLQPGTIRGDFGTFLRHGSGAICTRNICHGSDSVEDANREISIWFNTGELIDDAYDQANRNVA